MSRKISLIYGIIAGVATIGYYLLLYFSNKQGFFNLYAWWAGLIPMLIFMVLGTLRLRKGQGGKLGLSSGLQTSFLIFVVSSLLFYIFYFVLLKYIDPEMLKIQQETALKTLERFGQERGDDLEPYEEFYLEEGLEISLMTVIFRYVQSLIGGFILSLGIAFVLKNK
ncbi:MAG TPA: DUF4199 domain-containing protein [Saprospiraceae bacterium]|nr:DUF4199 domain-containing protein [Saprospiraceae bacterium]